MSTRRTINPANVNEAHNALSSAIADLDVALTVDELAAGAFRFLRHTCHGVLAHAEDRAVMRQSLKELASSLLLDLTVTRDEVPQ